MLTLKKLAAGTAGAALAAALATAAHAQETTGGINGAITDDAGHPLGGVHVTVVYGPTHQTFTATTDSTGQFTVRQLPVGGPYSVTATDATHQTKTVDVPQVQVGSAYQLNFTMENAGALVSAVVVTAARSRTATLQTGPSSTFSLTDIQSTPTFSRDLRDIARLNPFVTLDPTNQNAMIIAGNNNRVNTIYVDGVKESDDFGLNANGYPTQRSPISIDLVQSMTVLVAPYDVRYGSFEGGVLNIATLSGGNEFHGTAFYEYDSDKLGAGQMVRDRPVTLHFQDKAYGVTLGGPILKNRLFFEFGYEKYQSAVPPGFGPSDSSAAIPIPGVTSAQVAQVQSILKGAYNFDPLGYGGTAPTEDEKWFGKLTWQITDHHRFVFEAQHTDGTTFNQPDSSTNASNPELGLLSSTYLFEQPLAAYSGFLYSNWTPNLSTELSYTHRDVGGLTVNPAGNAFANFRIYLNGTASSPTSGPSIDLGPDISRQANSLTYTDQLFRARANYTLGQHTISAGYEREWLDVFNLFVQNATGAYTFAPTFVKGVMTVSGLQNLQARTATSLVYANAADNNANSGAAQWGDVLNTLFLQDEWRPVQGLTLQAGLRYDVYQQGDKPKLNTLFQQLYGFSNQATLDGKGLLQPRFGFNWRPEPTLTIEGGAGLFSGGNPNVWISNNYTNTGNLLGSVTCNANNPVCANAITNVDGYHVASSAQAANTASANLGTGVTNALDPNFKLPSVWKASIGFRKEFDFSQMGWTGAAGNWLGDNWRLHGDYLYQWTNEGVYWQDLSSLHNVVGAAPDGRPIFNPTPTNRLNKNVYDLLLTNTRKGGGYVWAVGIGKAWTSGIADGLDFDITYTRTRVTDVNPGTSSVALSNYAQVAFADPNHPSVAISNYNIRYEYKFRLDYEHAFFGDYKTRFSLFGQRRAGLPFSYTFSLGASGGSTSDAAGFGLVGAVAQRNNELLYVPAADSSGNVTATSDPKVSYASSFDVAAFNAYLHQAGLIQYAGRISPRNAFKSRDVTNVDLQVSQEIPTFFPHGSRAEVYFDIFNVGNMENSWAGVVDQIGFPYFASVVTPKIVPCSAGSGCAPGQTTQYLYQSWTTAKPTTNISGTPPASLWAFKIGIRYKF